MLQQLAVRAAATMFVGTILGVPALAALGFGLLAATGVDPGADPDHAPMEGTEGLAPHELGDQDSPQAE